MRARAIEVRVDLSLGRTQVLPRLSKVTRQPGQIFLYSAIGAIQSKSNDFVSLRASSDVLNLWIRMVGGSAAVMHLFGGRSG